MKTDSKQDGQESSVYPSVARLNKIEGIVTAEPAFKGKFSKKSDPNAVSVPKRGGGVVKYAFEVAEIGRKIAETGDDPILLGKSEILKRASNYFGIASNPESNGEAHKVEAKELDDSENSKEDEVEKGASESDESGSSTHVAGKVEINQNIAVYSLLMSAIQIAELDRKDGAADRRKKLSEVMSSYAGVLT